MRKKNKFSSKHYLVYLTISSLTGLGMLFLYATINLVELGLIVCPIIAAATMSLFIAREFKE